MTGFGGGAAFALASNISPTAPLQAAFNSGVAFAAFAGVVAKVRSLLWHCALRSEQSAMAAHTCCSRRGCCVPCLHLTLTVGMKADHAGYRGTRCFIAVCCGTLRYTCVMGSQCRSPSSSPGGHFRRCSAWPGSCCDQGLCSTSDIMHKTCELGRQVSAQQYTAFSWPRRNRMC